MNILNYTKQYENTLFLNRSFIEIRVKFDHEHKSY